MHSIMDDVSIPFHMLFDKICFINHFY